MIAGEMNFNRIHKEVSKDTPSILVLVTVACEPSSSSMCSVFGQVHVFYLFDVCSSCCYSLLYFYVSFSFRFNFGRSVNGLTYSQNAK